MSIYNLESFKEHIKEIETDRLVSVLEGIMLYSVETICLLRWRVV